MKLANAWYGAWMIVVLLTGCGGNSDTALNNGEGAQVRLLGTVRAQFTASDYRSVVQQLYIAYFGRPADPSGLNNFTAQLASIGAPTDIQGLVAAYESNPSVRALIDSFGMSTESSTLYSGDTTTFVTSVYKNMLNRAPNAGGLTFWVNAIDNGGLPKGKASLSIMAGALANTTSQGLADAKIVSNKVAVATNFTASLSTSAQINSYSGKTAAATARGMLGAVTDATDTNAFQTNINATLDVLAAIADSGTSPAVTFVPNKVLQTYTAGNSITFSVNATVVRPQDFSGASTIYTYIVDNVGVVTPNASIVPSGSTSYMATFNSSPSIVAGKYQGNLMLKLCRDSACTSQFPGSPVLLPYEFNVLPPAASPLSASNTGSLTTTMHVGGLAPADIGVSVGGNGLTWNATANVSWINLTGASGSGSGSFKIGFTGAGLAQGQYSGTVTVTSTDGQKVELPVALTVLPTAFQITSAGATFSAINGAPIASQAITLTLDNGVPTGWTATSDSPWLTANPAAGTTPGTIALTANPGAGPLASGSYNANLVFSASTAASKSLPVQLNLTKPTLAFANPNLTLGGTNGRDFTNRSLTLSLNTLTNSWPWTMSGLPSWVTPTQSSGTVNQSGASITFAPNIRNAPVGTSTVVFSATARVNGDTVSAPVSATIHKDQHRLLASETGVAFSSTPNWSRLTRTITVSDNYGVATNWTARSDQSWLSVTSSGVTGANGTTLSLSANPVSLPSDTVSYATVTLTSTDTTITASEQIKVAFWKGSATPGAITKLSQTYTRVIADPIRPLAYLHNGDTTIDAYNIYTAQKVGSLVAVGNALGDMTISPNGDKLYVLDTAAKSLVVVDLNSWTKVATWTLANAVGGSSIAKAIRPNGVEIILIGDGTAYLAATGKRLSNSNIAGVITATWDGKHVFAQDQGYSPASVASYSVDYSEMSGGVLMVSLLKSASSINNSSNGREIAVSGDGTHLYTATGAPYRCTSVQPSDLTAIGSLPGGDAYPNNVKVGSDGRVYCGISGWYSTADVWVHSATGTLLSSYKFAGYARALRDRQLVVSGDGLMLVALTDDPRLVFVPVGP